jgi:hypothetical protein
MRRRNLAPPTPQGAYTVSVFAADNVSGCASVDASPTCYYNADSLTNDTTFVYVGYQNNGAANGSSGYSIVGKYARTGGGPLAFFGPFAGKTDGLRIDPFTGQLWALNNEDGNTVLRIIDPSTGASSCSRRSLPTRRLAAGTMTWPSRPMRSMCPPRIRA